MISQAEAEQLKRDKRKLERENASLKETIWRSTQTQQSLNAFSEVLLRDKSMQEKYMNLLLENCPDMMILLNKQGQFVNCTQAFLFSAGISNIGLVSMKPFETVLEQCVSSKNRKRLLQAYSHVMESKRAVDYEASMDFSFRATKRDYQISLTPMMDEEDSIEGALVLFHDVTEILEAKKQAEQANAAKSDFLAMVSHEIRTPMNAIMGLTEILLRTDTTDKQQEHLKNIFSSSKGLLNLINDILDFSKIEAKHQEVTLENFSLEALLNDTKKLFGALFVDRAITFQCDFHEDLPRNVVGDEKLIRQIISNILTNAYKYTNEGHVYFNIWFEKPNRLCFTVEDTGIGIKQEDLPRLFNAFEQLDRVNNKGVIGTGLGLAICKQLCQLMGGSIQVKSEYGIGSAFEVVLPVTPQDNNSGEEFGEDREFEAPSAQILVVDDIELNAMIACAMLETFAINADMALSGKEAIAMAKEKQYDLIFMDHMMPEMDGIEAVAHLRKLNEYYPNAPIIALTANAGKEAETMFMQNGLTDFVFKPLERINLARCLMKYLPKEKVNIL